MKKLLIEIDSINWYGTEYLSSVEGFKLIHHEFVSSESPEGIKIFNF